MHAKRDSAYYFLELAANLAKSQNLDTIYLESMHNLSKCYVLDGKFQKGINLVEEAKKYADKKEYHFYDFTYYYSLGKYYTYLQKPDSALLFLQKYDNLLVEDNRTANRWVSHDLMGRLYKNIGDWEKAKIYLLKSLEFARIEKKPMDYGYLLNTLITEFSKMNEIEIVSDLMEEYGAYKLSRNKKSDLTAMHSYANEPGVSAKEKEARLCTYLPIHFQSKNWLAAAQSTYALGNLLVEEGRAKEAIPYLKDGLVAADSFGLIDIILNLNNTMFRALDASGQPREALVYAQKVYDLREEIRDTERQSLVSELNIKYETEKKEKEIAASQLLLVQAKQRQKFWAFGVGMLLLLLGASIYAIRIRQKHNQELELKNDAISKALEEKKILLKEIHHRVKNNLQMISSLLYLQGKSIDDPTAKGAIQESENRVQSMAMLHQNLYQDENLLGVDVVKYLDRLIDHLFASYDIDQNRIALEKEMQINELDVDTVIPMALVINELMSNALKYAFKDGRKGKIKITIKENKNNIYVSVEDDGLGLPDSFNPKSGGNFGYKLIRILTQQLKADWHVESTKGTKVYMEVPKAS